MSVPEEPVPPKRSPGLLAVAVAAVVFGLLILVPSGLCTGFFGLMGFDAGLRSGHWGILIEALRIGTFPILFGGASVWAGIQILRGKW